MRLPNTDLKKWSIQGNRKGQKAIFLYVTGFVIIHGWRGRLLKAINLFL